MEGGSEEGTSIVDEKRRRQSRDNKSRSLGEGCICKSCSGRRRQGFIMVPASTRPANRTLQALQALQSGLAFCWPAPSSIFTAGLFDFHPFRAQGTTSWPRCAVQVLAPGRPSGLLPEHLTTPRILSYFALLADGTINRTLVTAGTAMRLDVVHVTCSGVTTPGKRLLPARTDNLAPPSGLDAQSVSWFLDDDVHLAQCYLIL